MFSFDLKSGYNHIEIASEHQTFLGFSWKFHQAEGYQYFVFLVKIAICLDDGLVIENDYGVCKTLSSRIKEDLRRVGFVANAEKSIWDPVQSIV